VIIWSIEREPLKTWPGGKRKLPGALKVREGNLEKIVLLFSFFANDDSTKLIEDGRKKKR